MPQTARPVRLRRPGSRPAPARNQAARYAHLSRWPITERNRATDLPMRPDSARPPTRRSRTVRRKCHARRPYQPFQCAAHPTARKGVTGPADHRWLAGLARRSRLHHVRDEEAELFRRSILSSLTDESGVSGSRRHSLSSGRCRLRRWRAVGFVLPGWRPASGREVVPCAGCLTPERGGALAE
jgi:hypothetical protein